LFELHFADSELQGLRWQDGSLLLVFAAAHVWPLDGRLGHGPGHVRHLALHLTAAQLQGDAASAFGRVADGRWQPEGQRPQRTMTVPQAIAGAVQLSLSLANGTAIDLRGASLRAVFNGEPGFCESMAC
jgi:hypothetical protein